MTPLKIICLSTKHKSRTENLSVDWEAPDLTFACWEKAVHLHTAARVRDTQSAAGHQSLLKRALVCGPYQTPSRPVAGPLQQLHRLTGLDAELRRAARHKVLQDHRQLTPSRELEQSRGTDRMILVGVFVPNLRFLLA